MPNSSTTVCGTRRGGPTFKFYWVENGHITAIKRYDEVEPIVLPYRVFRLIEFVFPQFKVDQHVVKFQDDSDLIELTESDCVRFNTESGDMQVYMYIFSSEEEASRTVTPPTSCGPTTKPPQFVSPVSQSSSTQVSFPASTVTFSQPQASAVPQSQVEAKTSGGTQETPTSETDDGAREGGRTEIGHEYVICDGCEGSIPSHRYKCLQCPDFDLCASCEANGLHPEHLMARVPLHFVEVYGSAHRDILHRLYSAAASEFNDNVVIDLGKQLKEVLKAFGIELDHIGEGKHCEGKRCDGRRRKEKHCPGEKLSDFKHHSSFKRWIRREKREEARAQRAVDTQSEATSTTDTTTTNRAPFDPSAPITIPISIPVTNSSDVQTSTPTPAPASAAASAPPAPTGPSNTVTDGPAVYPLLDISSDVIMDGDIPRPGEWLVVNSVSGEASSAVAEEKPALRENKDPSPIPFLHSDPIVNVALEKLAMMGYRIDDPTLVKTVEQCNGNIIQILDCLLDG